MPPQPITATVEPGSTFAVLSAAPTPVITPQPTSAALSSGIPESILITDCLGSTAYSAITAVLAKWLRALPAESVSREVPSGMVLLRAKAVSHSQLRPITQ